MSEISLQGIWELNMGSEDLTQKAHDLYAQNKRTRNEVIA